jgi:hypothetical protein
MQFFNSVLLTVLLVEWYFIVANLMTVFDQNYVLLHFLLGSFQEGKFVNNFIREKILLCDHVG